MRRVLDDLELEDISKVFSSRFKWLERLGLKQEYYFLKKHLVVPVDGVHYFSSKKIKKNDCELNASKRLITNLSEQFKDESLLLVEDALYANAPHIKQILSHKWDYLINVKPSSHEGLFKYFEARLQRKQIQKWTIKDGKYTHHFCWINNAPLNQSSDVRCNFLYYEQEDHKGKIQVFHGLLHSSYEKRTSLKS